MKIKSIKRIKLKESVPVYDLTVDGTENFALESGIIVHNSKDVADAVCGVVHSIVENSDSYGSITARII